MSAAPSLLKAMKISVEIVGGPSSGTTLAFDKGHVTIGRGPENDIIIGQDTKISRQHAEFIVTLQQVILKNLSQKNQISVDGELTQEKALRPGAVIRLGESELRIQFEPPVRENKPVTQMSVTSTKNLSPASGMTSSHPTPWQRSHEVMQSQSEVPGFVSSAARPAEVSYQARPVPNESSRTKFYIVVVVVLLAGYWLFQEQKQKRKEVKLRDSVTTELAITNSQNEIEKTQKEIDRKGFDTTQYKLAQEQYLRGFRDYRQGQFVRAMEAFQAALSFFPTHELSRKYYILAKRKFDEQVQFNMIQGKRYYGLQNYRLCMSHYSNVIKMKKDERDPVRREALQYYRECELNMREKF